MGFLNKLLGLRPTGFFIFAVYSTTKSHAEKIAMYFRRIFDVSNAIGLFQTSRCRCLYANRFELEKNGSVDEFFPQETYDFKRKLIVESLLDRFE